MNKILNLKYVIGSLLFFVSTISFGQTTVSSLAELMAYLDDDASTKINIKDNRFNVTAQEESFS